MPKNSILTIAVAQALLLSSARAATLTVNSTLDAAPADDGVCTLREAIENANTDSQNGRTGPGECPAGSGLDAIEFDAGVFGAVQTITLTQGEMAITDSVTITGPGQDLLTIDANASSRHFAIDDGDTTSASDVTISDLTLVNGEVTNASGGSIDSRENLSLARTTLYGNTVLGGGTDPSLGRGGALNVDGEGQPGLTISLDEVRIEANVARNGGGLSVDLRRTDSPSSVTIENTLIDGNRSRSNGPLGPGNAGGRMDLGGEANLDLRDSIISNNQAESNLSTRIGGLAIFADAGSDLLVERVEVLNNTAGIKGQGSVAGLRMYLQSELCESARSMSEDSEEQTNGGGRGGCIGPALVSSMRLIDSTIAGNVAIGDSVGGLAFAASGPGTFLIENTTISGNTAGTFNGGVELVAYGAIIQLVNSTISGNRANGRAGGIDAYAYPGEGFLTTYDGEIQILNSTIVGNEADADGNGDGTGGGIRVNNSSYGTLRLEGSIVAGNQNDSAATPMPDLDADLGGDMTLEVFTTLIGDNSGSGLIEAPLGFPDVNGNLIGDPGGSGVIDPLLGPLSDNGGQTQTHAPRVSSPALDAAGACTGVDQRGVPRPQGPACDMGSVELTDGVFSDRFEAANGFTDFGRRLALLSREDVLRSLATEKHETLLLQAGELGQGGLRQAWVHARRSGPDAEVRISRFEHGQLSLGDWATAQEPTLALRW